jgi:hypothetical protein
MQSRLAFIVPFPFLPARSGGQAAAAGFSQFLGQTTGLTVLSTPGNAAAADVSYELLPLLRPSVLRYVDLSQLPRIGRALRERSVERIIVQQHFAAPLFWLLARRNGMRLEVWSHNLEYRRFRTMGRWFWPLVWLTEWLGYFLADRVYFISPDEIATARRVFGLAKAKCQPLPYGTPLQQPPIDYTASRQRTRKALGLPDDCLAICFFGALAYGPNAQALDYILSKILPELDRLNSLNYRLLIGGKGLDTQRPELANDRITYLGFIPDLMAFCAAGDLLLNPVATGAGVKTKVIDAIAAGLTVVSSPEGALGVSPAVCGAQLKIVAQHDPTHYVSSILRVREAGTQQTPDSFYRHYYWGAIVQRVYL